MSPIDKMPNFQSKMHFDESLESNADSDLADGEIRKLLTSSQCAQEATGKPYAMVVQEREVSAQTSHYQKVKKLRGTRCIVFNKTL